MERNCYIIFRKPVRSGSMTQPGSRMIGPEKLSDRKTLLKPWSTKLRHSVQPLVLKLESKVQLFGLFEPSAPSLPSRDRIGQIRMARWRWVHTIAVFKNIAPFPRPGAQTGLVPYSFRIPVSFRLLFVRMRWGFFLLRLSGVYADYRSHRYIVRGLFRVAVVFAIVDAR